MLKKNLLVIHDKLIDRNYNCRLIVVSDFSLDYVKLAKRLAEA